MDFAPPYSINVWRAIFIAVGLLIVIGIVLFTMDRCGGYFANKDIDKAKAEVNAALANVNAAKGTVANDRVDEAVALTQVNGAVANAVAASNATEQQKAETNAALANYEAAKKAGIPTGVTEEDLRKKLEALDQ